MTNSQTITLEDLAAELGIEQTPSQPLPGADVLIGFAGLDNDATEVTHTEAAAIREAWATYEVSE